MPKEQAVYSHGHHSSVVSSHARRTVFDSAGFLIPHIKPTDYILDLGCGPGSITVGLAKLVPQGRVLGTDAIASVLDQARSLAVAEAVMNIEFEAGDGNAMPYATGTFDIVFCHQVLQHVKDPVSILREMRRVAKPGGIVAARDADYGAFTWYPAHQALDHWRTVYVKQARANGGEPDAGRMLHAWARQAGFEVENIRNTVSSWCYSGQQGKLWGESWSERTTHSNFGTQVQQLKLATDEEIAGISNGWKDWSTKEDVWFNIPNGEMLFQIPPDA